jgi:hypothetical protein
VKTETRSLSFILPQYQLKVDLNIKPGNVKLVQERMGTTLGYVDVTNNFQTRATMARQLRERMDKWDYINPKSFCKQKKVTRLETALRKGENLCQLFI